MIKFFGGAAGGDKETQQLTNGIIITFFTTTNVRVANFPFVNGRFHFIDTLTFFDLFLYDSIKNKEDSKWNCKPVLT